jgi:biotin carboxyl carrier protein
MRFPPPPCLLQLSVENGDAVLPGQPLMIIKP